MRPVPTSPRSQEKGEEVFNALSRAHAWWDGCHWEITDINGGRGAILTKNDQPVLTITFACNAAGLICDIFITLNRTSWRGLIPLTFTK